MALATTVVTNPALPLQFAAAVTVFPADSSLKVELWRAPDNGSGGPNDAASVLVTILPPMPITGGVYDDPLNADGATYYYKARHAAQPGWQASAFSAYSNGVTAGEIGSKNNAYVKIPFQPMRVQRAVSMSDGNYAVSAVTSDGLKANKTVGVSGQLRTLSQMMTELVPNGDFDIWDSTSPAVPHGWDVDTTAGAVAAQESAAPFSGDYSAKYSNPDNASNSGWHGFNTDAINKGVFCVPLRPGLTYRVMIASKTSRIAGGQQYRLLVYYNSGATLTETHTFTYTAANVWQVDTCTISVPAGADPNSEVWVQFNRNGDATATDFWVDSLRLVEATPSAADLVAAASNAGANIVQNGGFESGVSYWRLENGTSLDSTTTTPIVGSKSGKILSVASTLMRVQQCDRASDLSGNQNPTTGNPLYIPVNGGDELYGTMKWNAVTNDGASTEQFGVEEYDVNFSLIQRTYFAVSHGFSSTVTQLGGCTLQATTAYIVVIVEQTAGPGGGSITYKFDNLQIYRVSPPTPRVKAVLSAGQTCTTGIETTVSWGGTDEFDLNSWHDPVGAPTVLSAPGFANGVGAIQLHAQIQFASNAAGYRRVKIQKNGTTVAEAETNAINGDVTTLSCSVLLHRPASGDQYKVLVLQNSGGNLNVQSGNGASFFEAILLK